MLYPVVFTSKSCVFRGKCPLVPGETFRFYWSVATLTVSQKALTAVTPAKAGVQKPLLSLDSRLHGNDRKRRFVTFYEAVNFGVSYFSEFLFFVKF
jgi:hypothetical protein